MANTDTLLDFGDDSPTSPKKADLGDSIGPSANGDPFDPFGSSLVDENQLISDPLEPSELDDPFDPFSGPRTTKSDKMENGTTALSQDDTQKYEAQFADLLGDLSGDGITMENGEIDGGTVTTITKTDIIEDGDGSQVRITQQNRCPYDELQISTDDNRLSFASYSISPPPSELNRSITDQMDDLLGDMPDTPAPKAEMEGDTDEDVSLFGQNSPSDIVSPDVISRDFGQSIQSEVEQNVEVDVAMVTDDTGVVAMDTRCTPDEEVSRSRESLENTESEKEAEAAENDDDDHDYENDVLVPEAARPQESPLDEYYQGGQFDGEIQEQAQEYETNNENQNLNLIEEEEKYEYTASEKSQIVTPYTDAAMTSSETEDVINDNKSSKVTINLAPTVIPCDKRIYSSDEETSDKSPVPFEEEPTQEKEPGTPTSVSSEHEETRGILRRSSSEGNRPVPQFEDTLSDYQPPKRYVKQQNEKENKGPNVFITSNAEKSSKTPRILGAGGVNMCKLCNKRVYEMEKMIADKDIYHKMCFKCNHCKRVLSLGNFASINGQTYCKPHFIELFKKKGKYDMGQPPAPKSSDQTDAVKAEPATESYAQQRVNGDHYEEEEEEVEMKQAQKEEPVHFQQMSSVRNMFETASRTPPSNVPAPVPLSKRVSKWDKPKEPAPAPAPAHTPSPQREPELEYEEPESEIPEEEQLPPAQMTRNLVARFRVLEQGSGFNVPDRKPVHKITPPRDELARSIEEARQVEYHEEQQSTEREIIKSGDPLNPEEELPPPQLTKSMLAKFRSLEDVNQPSPVSPQRSESLKKTPVDRQPQPKPRQASRASPDSGIVDVDSHIQNDHNVDAVDSSENELPEEGFTRNLVARWRTMEVQNVEATPPSAKHTESKKSYAKTTSQPAPVYKQQREPSPEPYQQEYEDEEEDEREILRESDTHEEEFLPPASFTKNMLAKFQDLEAEAERQAHEQQVMPAKKHFKWTVKEAPLINRSGMVWQEKRRGSSFDGDLSYDSQDGEHNQYDSHGEYTQDEQAFYSNGIDEEHLYEDPQEVYERDDGIVHADDPADHEDELPPQAFTKNMLAKFRSMESVDQAPPTPERAAVVQKAAYRSTSGSGIRTFSSTSSINQSDLQMSQVYDEYDQYDDQYDNGEYDDEHVESGEYENEPFQDIDHIKEGDRHEEDELPEQGITRNLLAKFQSISSH